jgi:hypoxanthine phosphoribosyltransferase
MPEVLISEEDIRDKVAELARRISADYRDVDDLILIGVLKGSFIFLADLARRLTIPRSIDFMALSTYGEGTETDGAVRMIMDLRRNIAGQHVLIVEDIVDTGLTLASLHRMLETRDPNSIRTVALLDKAPRRIVDVDVEYRGFEVGDEFLLGYGLDWNGRYRNLRSLWAVMDLAELSENPERFSELVHARGASTRQR